jgi:MFS family permease
LLLGWPHSNVDESTVGEMAINIAYHGDHPVFFYGQDYMGALQAYLAAGLFSISEASLFNLRLAQLLLLAIFLGSIYLLTKLLYGRGLALFTTLLLGFGNYLTIYRETQAIGGYPDTLAFGGLVFLLASWLALTSPSSSQVIRLVPPWKRMLAFAGWGLTAGLGLWSDLLIVPCLLLSGLLLLIVCWREWRSLAPFALMSGLIVGALPLILFNIMAAPGHDSLTTLRQIYNHGNTPLLVTLPQTLKSALLVGLPTFSNFPAVCSVNDTLFMGGHGHRALLCAVFQGGWSAGVILLWLVALLLAGWTIVRNRRLVPQTEKQIEQRRTTIIALARLSLLLSAAMTFVLYATSTTAIYEPYLSSRYLIAILLATPAVLYPLWQSSNSLKGIREGLSSITGHVKSAPLAAIAAFYVLGTLLIFTSVPKEQMQNQQEVTLVQTIMSMGVKHVYSDFWTCDNLIFISRTRILCNTTDEHMKPDGSRYHPFGREVLTDPKADYIFPINSPHAQACKKFLTERDIKYQRYEINNYVIYRLL